MLGAHYKTEHIMTIATSAEALITQRKKHYSCAIGIFAKTPELSAAKTRLAKTIGQPLANTFYQHSVAATAELICHLQSESAFTIKPFWALAEKAATQLPQWQTYHSEFKTVFTPIWTGDGNLGERLHSVYQRLLAQHDFVLLMGTDSPQLTPQLLENTLLLLQEQQNNCVIGPALDGGFYLIAAARPLGTDIWLPVQYSNKDTLVQLSNNLNKQTIKQSLLTVQNDVDTFDDLLNLQRTLSSCNGLLPKQKILLTWINTLLKELDNF